MARPSGIQARLNKKLAGKRAPTRAGGSLETLLASADAPLRNNAGRTYLEVAAPVMFNDVAASSASYNDRIVKERDHPFGSRSSDCHCTAIGGPDLRKSQRRDFRFSSTSLLSAPKPPPPRALRFRRPNANGCGWVRRRLE